MEAGLLSGELVEILHGRERRPEVLDRNLGGILALVHHEKADPLLRRYAIAALLLYGGDSALNTLLTLATGSSEDWAKEAAFYALAEGLPQRSFVADLLLREVATENSGLKGHAMSLLMRKGVLIPPELLLKAVDEYPSLAVAALASQRGTDALPYLDHLAGNEGNADVMEHARLTADKVRRGETGISRPVDDPDMPALRLKTTIKNGGVTERVEEVLLYPIYRPPPPASK